MFKMIRGGTGSESRLRQNVIGFFHQDFFSSSHGVRMCVRLKAISSLSVTRDFKIITGEMWAYLVLDIALPYP